jgi:hypothetical protein
MIEILSALNLICSILGISVKDIPNILNKKNTKKKLFPQIEKNDDNLMGNIFENEQQINGLVLLVLTDFLWNGQTGMYLTESSDYAPIWKQRDYNIFMTRLNDKLEKIDYTATINKDQVIVVTHNYSKHTPPKIYSMHIDITKNNVKKATTYSWN